MPRRAAQRASGAVDEPNVILPLATSINERGVAGYTHSVTNSEDQRKVNCFYEIAKNAATGKGTLTLSKRPGVTIVDNTYGTTTQTAYLMIVTNVGIPVYNAIVNVDGTSVQSKSGTHTQAIVTSATHKPKYFDITSLSNIQNAVVQTMDSGTFLQRVWFLATTGFIFNTTWTEIVDADFTGLSIVGKMEHLDGFAFILASNNLIWNSDSNSLANWTSTSFLAKSIKQDSAVGLARLKNMILAFGSQTVEVFYNAGNTTGSPLGRIPTLHQQIGLIIPPDTLTGSTHYYATVKDKIYFIGRGSGSNANAGFYMFDGSNFNKLSSGYIDKILSEKYATFYSVNNIGLFGRDAIGIGFSAPGASPQTWLIYFIDFNEWFEWNSTVFSPVNDKGNHLGVGSNQNKAYTFAASDNWQDDGTSNAYYTQFRLPTNGSALKFMPMYGVDADTDTSANTLTVEISTDDCVTFSTIGTIDLTQDRKVLFSGGSFRKAHIRLGNTNARPTRIHNFLARIE